MSNYRLLCGDVLEQLATLPSASVHCVVTSPPYWRLRQYGDDPSEIGREDTVQAYVARLVEVFRQVRRVLRPDGTCWINIADSYANDKRGPNSSRSMKLQGSHIRFDEAQPGDVRPWRASGLKRKDRCAVPERLILALWEDGWYYRDEVIWHKLSTMPFSGADRTTSAHEKVYMLTRSERYFYDHVAIKTPLTPSSLERLDQDVDQQMGSRRAHDGAKHNGAMKAVRFGGAKYRDGHTKSGNEWDPQRHAGQALNIGSRKSRDPRSVSRNVERDRGHADAGGQPYVGATKRSVWSVATAGYRDAHFATFPPSLVEPMILAGTSERGCCPQCGAPWRRVLRKGEVNRSWQRASGGDCNGEYHGRAQKDYESADAQDASEVKARILAGMRNLETAGWYPNCSCLGLPSLPALEADDGDDGNDGNDGDEEMNLDSSFDRWLTAARDYPIDPCVVLDPFAGTSTTGEVALRHCRNYIGIELYEKNVALARKRLANLQPQLLSERL